ncbi:MAG: endolytic transglycosylase MltG [Gammaproteobacteria bacterium]|nr:endolytic transglycosylase MltG [Gammaproteobacteria bacterium]
MIKIFIFKAVGLLVLAGSVGLAWLLADFNQFKNAPINVSGEGWRYEIKSGDTLKRVANKLHVASIIDNPHYLVWLGRYKGTANNIKIGEYLFTPGTTTEQLLKKIVDGNTIQYSATIVEGLTFREMMVALAQNEALVHTLKGLKPAQIMAQLGYANEHPEGRFLPDTYHFPKGTTDVAFLSRAYDAMKIALATQWQQRDVGLPLKTPYEALILASIIEKETAVPSERGAIAGVFVRRLQKKMRLQTDPTVIYGLGEKFDGNLRRRDLRADNPYNTYRRHGLPPTPIAMPGVEAIQAALHPLDGDALYFVARGNGSHQFSATLKEHNNAVIKYQLKGRKKSFSSYNAKQ